jgi:nucleotide-binding universal stress UspA family protein
MPKNLKILVPVDFSRHSLETLRFALSLRDYFAATYVLLHVVPAGEAETFATLGGESSEVQTRRVSETLAELEREAERRRQEVPGIELACRVTIGVPLRKSAVWPRRRTFSSSSSVPTVGPGFPTCSSAVPPKESCSMLPARC